MTIVHEMGDRIPPPFKAGSPEPVYSLELVTKEDGSLTMLIPTGMEVHPKYPVLRDRYWQAHKCHVEMANIYAKAKVPIPCGYVVMDSNTNAIIGVGAYRSDDTPHDRAWIDAWIFEVFCGQDPAISTKVGMALDGLSPEQIEVMMKRTGAKTFAVVAQKQSA
jgi:hypothetical protein